MKTLQLFLLFFFTAQISFAQTPVKISALPTATGTGAGSFMPIVQNNITKKILSDSLTKAVRKHVDSINSALNTAMEQRVQFIQLKDSLDQLRLKRYNDSISFIANIATKLSIDDTTNKWLPQGTNIPSQFNPIAGTNISLSGLYPNITFNSTSEGSSSDTVSGRHAQVNGGGTFGDTAILQRTDTIISFGASVESGGAGTGGSGINKWISYLNKDLGTTEINRAIGGTPFATYAGDDSAFINRLFLIPPYRKGIRYIIIGASNFINDVGLYGTTNINTTYSAVLRAIDTLTIARGYPLNRIIFLTPSTVGVSNSGPYAATLTKAALKRVSDTVLIAAKSKGVVTIDVFKLTEKFITDGNTIQFLLADSVHPTPEGHFVIANIVSTFLGTLKVNNSIRVQNNITVGKSAEVQDYLMVGSNNTANPTSSIGTFNSTTRGILPPRMTTTQRNAIANPFNGLFIFNTTTAQYNYYDSIAVAWQNISIGTASGWGLTGNSGTSASTNFLGTTDDNALVFKVNNIKSGLIGTTAQGFSTGLGSNTLVSLTSGNGTGIGQTALFSLTSGIANTALGKGSAVFTTTGSGNTAVGDASLQSNVVGGANTAVGRQALFNNTASNNTALGEFAGSGITTGTNNVVIGRNTMQAALTGSSNNVIGVQAFNSMTSGAQNNGVGLNVLYFTTSGSRNSVLGNEGMQNNTTGSNNVALGFKSGFYNTTADNQIFINSLDRTNYTGDQTGSPIYIVQNTTVANQKTTINGKGNVSVTPEYADNAAAVAGGLVNGDIYRTGDLMKIVHP